MLHGKHCFFGCCGLFILLGFVWGLGWVFFEGRVVWVFFLGGSVVWGFFVWFWF